MKLYVGQAFSKALLKGGIRAYRAHGFQLIEFVAQPGRLPKLNKLASFARAEDGFATSVLLDPMCMAETSKSNEAAVQSAIDYGSKLVELIKPHWVVLRSGPELRPGPASVARLARAAESWRADERRIAWEPRGLWEPYQVRAAVRDLGLHRVQEATRFEVEPLSYVRVVELGVQRGARISTLEGLAERLLDAEEAYVIIEGTGAKGALRVLQDVLSDQNDDELDEDEDLDELTDGDEDRDESDATPDESGKTLDESSEITNAQ